MDINTIKTISIIVFVTAISAIGDSQGFLHASRLWQEGKLIPLEILKSGVGFLTGIITYWILIYFLQKMGVVSAEIQALLWFVLTIIGVAVVSKEFLEWKRTDQLIAFLVITGISWLLYSTSKHS